MHHNKMLEVSLFIDVARRLFVLSSVMTEWCKDFGKINEQQKYMG
jgi:hypothetical protein